MGLLWIGFFAVVLGLLALDLGMFHREAHEISLREGGALGDLLDLARPELFFDKEPHGAAAESWFLRVARRTLPVAAGDHGKRFLVRERGRLMLTNLSVALIAVEFTDLMFAVDSVPAVLAISTDTFIVVTSNIFAILGLRSLYFVLASMMTKFRYLKPALAVLLIFIGAKLLLHSHVKFPNWVSLSTVVGIVGLGVVASLVADRKRSGG